MAIHTPTRSPRTRQYVKELESQAESVQDKPLAITNLPDNVEFGPVKEVESEILGTFDMDDHPVIKSETPLLLSPTRTASTASSPGIGNDVWDSPLPSSHHLGQYRSNVALTPLTPPSADGASPDSIPAPKARKAVSVKSVEEGAARNAVATLHAKYCAKTDLPVDATLEEDYFFKPQKLIRNLTKELQAIVDANAVEGQPRYNLRPNFDFPGAAGSYTSAQPRHSMDAMKHNVKRDEDVKPHTEIVGTAAVDNKKSLPRTRKSSKPLHPDLEHIIPMAIQSRVTEKPGTCVASLVGRPHERCSLNGPGAIIDTISSKLSRCNIEVNPARFIGYITELIQATMCGIHRNSALSIKRQEILKDLVTRKHLPDVELAEFQAWVNAITSSDPPARVQTPKVHVPPKDVHSAASTAPKTRDVPVAPSSTRSSFTIAPLKKQAYLHGFTAYQPKRTQSLSVPAALLEEIMKPVKPSAPKDGYIYLFWEPPNFGAVKIGRTNDLARRLAEWNRDCKLTHMYHPASQRGELSQIPHVNRIERLIHIELKNYRCQRYCKSCTKTHREWFHVAETLVTQVFRKWYDWIMQRPYTLNAGTGKWELRPEMMETLAQVCEPVAGVKKQLPPLRRAVGGANGRGKGKRKAI